jgi:hypothetical protein
MPSDTAPPFVAERPTGPERPGTPDPLPRPEPAPPDPAPGHDPGPPVRISDPTPGGPAPGIPVEVPDASLADPGLH